MLILYLPSFSQNLCGFDDFNAGNETVEIYPPNTHVRLGTTDTFDVVFHLIHLGEPIGEGANISDAQVASAILHLNRDFGKWAIHDSVAITSNGVDSEIFFRLACIDPNGNATNLKLQNLPKPSK